MKMLYWQAKRAAKKNIKEFFRRLLFLNYQFLPASSIKKQAITFEFRGQPLTVEADYTSALYDNIMEIVDYDCYQLSEINFSKAANGIVMDVGANIGIAAMVLARAHPGRVVCFEPMPGNCKLVESNARLNGLTNVEVVPAALTATDGTVEFLVNPNYSSVGHTADTVKSDPLAFSQKLQVKSLSLPSALAPFGDRPIELIKLDCEGGEYAIVKQITPSLAERIRYLSFEVHDLDRQRNVTVMTKRLKALGYRVVYKHELYKRLGLHHLLASRP